MFSHYLHSQVFMDELVIFTDGYYMSNGQANIARAGYGI